MSKEVLSQDLIKKKIAAHCANFIEDGMVVGLGTGSTAKHFIDALILRTQRENLNIQACTSSIESYKQAKKGQLNLIHLNDIESIDLTVDGADEVDPQLQMIKGAGGAHLREKILAHASKKCIYMIDESKLVDQLGKTKLPIEIIPFAYKSTLYLLKKLGFSGELRTNPDQTIHLTDSKNYLFDLHTTDGFKDPKLLDQRIKEIPGVIETGFFFTEAQLLVVGYENGEIQEISRNQ